MKKIIVIIFLAISPSPNTAPLNHWQINKTKEKKKSWVSVYCDTIQSSRKGKRQQKVVFFTLQKLDLLLYTSVAIAPVLDAHKDNIFLRYCSLCIIKIQLKNHIITSTAPLYNLLHSAWPLCWLGMRGIPVMEKYRYLLYFKRYNIIILLISVFHTLLFRSSPLGGSASQIAASPVNLTTEQRDGSNRLNSINAPEMNK